MPIIKWTGSGLLPIDFWFRGVSELEKWLYLAMQTSSATLGPRYSSPCQLFWSAAWLLPSSFRCSNPHQLSNQHSLVHSALTPHHPVIIAKSLPRGTDREHILFYQPSFSHESSMTHSRSAIMSTYLKDTNAIKVPLRRHSADWATDLRAVWWSTSISFVKKAAQLSHLLIVLQAYCIKFKPF